MNPGQLDQRVTVERRGDATDAYGQPLPDDWAPLCTVWAAVEPLQGREFIAAQAAVSEVSARIRMRYRPGITPAMRVVHGADVYGIEAVIHVRSAKRELQLMCKALG